MMTPGRYLNQLVFGTSAGVMAPESEEEPIVASTAHWSVENEIRFPWVRSIRLAFERVVDVTDGEEEALADPMSEVERQKLYVCERLGEAEDAASAAGFGDLAISLSSLALMFGLGWEQSAREALDSASAPIVEALAAYEEGEAS